MKKLFKLIVLAIVALTLSLVAVACGGGGGGSSKKLAAPTELSLDNMILSWGEVEGATGYEVSIDGKDYLKIDETEIDVETMVTSEEVTRLYVRAVGGEVSEYPVVVTKLATPNKPRIEVDSETKTEKFVWDKVTDAKKYLIQVNDGKWVVNSSNYFTTTNTGSYVIKVKCKSYSEDNYIYLESDVSPVSDTLDLLVGSTLVHDITHTLSWDIGEFESFNLWVDGECVATDIMPGTYDEELEGWTGYNFVEAGIITKTGEYDMQLECIKGGKSAWSNVLTEVGTLCIGDQEITTFDNRRFSINNVDAAVLTSVSTDIKHGEKGASLRIEKAVQVNLNLTGLHTDKLNLQTVESVSYWVYLEKPEDVTDEEASIGYIPVIIYDAYGTGVASQVFDPQNLNGASTVPWNTWIEVKATVMIKHEATLILKARGPYPVYIDDIYYTSLIEEPANAEANGLTSNKAIRFVKDRYTASYQKTTISLGEEFGGRDDVSITMDVYLHTEETQAFGFCLYSWQDGQVNASGNHAGRPIGFVHYKAPSTTLEIGHWTTITFKAQKLNDNGDFVFSPGTYEDTNLGFTYGQSTFWIYVKNVKAKLPEVTKADGAILNINADKDVEAIELYINNALVAEDISKDIVRGKFDLVESGYLAEDDYYARVKVVFIKSGAAAFTSNEIIFEKLTEGVQVAYNGDGSEPVKKGQTKYKGVSVPIDLAKFDDDPYTFEWINVTMDVKGSISVGADGSVCTGGIHMRAFNFGPGDVRIKSADFHPFDGVSSWFAACTATEWITIQVRMAKDQTVGGLTLVPFSYPGSYPITMYVRNIEIDYSTLSSEQANPLQKSYNAKGSEIAEKSQAAGSTAIYIPIDLTKFDADANTMEWVTVTMKVKGSIAQGADGTSFTVGTHHVYVRAYNFGVGDGRIKGADPYIISGADSWYAACTATEWTEITVRLPKNQTVGGLAIVPFCYPGAYPITMWAKDIVVDHSTISTTK